MNGILVRRAFNLAKLILPALFLAGCFGEGSGPEPIAGTPAPALSGVLVDAPVSGVSWEATSGLAGTTDDMGTFEYLSFDNLTFSVGDIILGTTPGAPVISAVELTGSSNPTDQAAVNLLVFLQSIDADSDPSNGITITDSARVNASGISLDFHSVDFATQIEAVVTILVPGNTVVSETDALNHFYNTYAELGGTDTFAFDFPGYPPVGGGASFELVFADEFNEGTSPNPDNWTIETGYGPGDSGWGNNEWQLYTDSPDNVRVENGNLVLSALCPVAPCGIRDGSITSGKINTLGKFDFKFGKIVARIKPPVGKAAWPAFWALGTNFPEIGWPRSGEIDFMEIHNFYSDENTTHFTMHWWDEQTESWVFDTQYLTTAESLGDGFHIFEADWNEDRIIGKIDGQTYFTREIEPDTMEEFLEEFYMILNVAMGGTLGSGNEPPAGDEIFPQTMLVDYVRVFQGSDGTLPGGGVLANFDDLIPSTITEFDGAGYAIEAGPEGGDGNALRITRDGGEVYAGVFISVAGIPSDAGEQTISALVYSPTAGTPFVTKLEYGQNEGTPDVQANETVVEGWQTLTWTYTNLEAGQDYNRLVMLPNLGTVGAGESYFIDNITLLGPGDDGGDGDGDGSGTGGDAPTVAAMTPPTRDAANVVSLFSDAYTDVTVDTWKTDWSITAFADVDIAGNATKEYTSLNFVGIETVAEQVDTTGMTHLHVDMWTPNAESLEIKLVDFGANAAYDGPGAGDDTEGSVFLDAESTPALAQGTWVSLDIPLADFEAAGLTDRANIAQLIFAAAPSNEVTLYIDNVYFYTAGDGGTGGGDAPTAAAPTPTQDAGNVISLFSDAYTDVAIDTWRTPWSVGDLTDVTIDGQLVKQYTNLDFVGIESTTVPLDLTGGTHFHVDVWTPNAEQLRIKLVDFGADGLFGGGDDTEAELVFDETTTPAIVQGEWISLDIPLADFQSAGLANVDAIAQLIFSASPPGTSTLYVTNVYFYNDDGGVGGPGPTAPTVSAPTPTQDPANVLSLYSDAYTDVEVTWPTVWSAVETVNDVTIDGGMVKEHLAVGFVGIEFASLDVSGMTHFHMDVWSPDADSLLVKLVDFGGDGFGGDNDTEGPLTFDGTTSPALTQGQWVSLDIPLSEMQAAGLAGLTDINQLIFDAVPDGTIVYVDNVYFYNDDGGVGGPGPTAPTVSAPTPMQDPANVISLYSDAYTDVEVTWPTSWSAPNDTTSDVSIDGGLVKEVLNMDFFGVEFASLDVSGMTHFHVDIWTADAETLLLKLVDFGGDGFGNGNDTEGPLTFDGTTTPALTQGQWVSLDIPLSEMQAAGLAGLTDINQLVFALTPSGAATLYLDNVYLYNDNAVGGGGIFVNGDFETGDFTGWTLTQDPPGAGSTTLDTSGQGGRGGTVARLTATGSDTAGFQNVVISQVGLAAGTIAPGDQIDVSFDLYGSLTGAGGVVFVEVIFLNGAGVDEGGRNFVGPAAPYVPSGTWTTHSGTVIAGTAVNGSQWDVSGGVTLELKVACGAVVGGCGVDASFDNVTFTINGG